MSDDTQHPIVIKKINKGHAGHHGGAWKLAYADFVTAMMAFFLLMWLLGSTAKGDLAGIAEYFQNPLKLSMEGGQGMGDSSSIIKGGGEDLSRSMGQIKRGDIEEKRLISLDVGQAGEAQKQEDIKQAELIRERLGLMDLKDRLIALIEADATLRQFKNQILVDVVSEGLRIQLIDEHNRPMFNTASDELRPYTKVLLQNIGRALNDVDHRISLSGHTDAARYAGGERGFSNWELSANRANASRRELIAGGLAPGKIIRVVGLADIVPLDKNDPLSAMNRRISIIVLNKQAEEAILKEGEQVIPESTAAAPDAAAPAQPGK